MACARAVLFDGAGLWRIMAGDGWLIAAGR